jgi:hypothetical protein
MAAIEVYNKPTFSYRDECAVILLTNAWELLLKATLSKNGQSIFYRKKQNQPYRTFSWQDAFAKATPFFPGNIGPLALRRNLDLLGTYRDNAVHFYSAAGFEAIVYALAQTSIKNFRDLMQAIFGHRLEDEINWKLLPLGIAAPIDVVSYMAGGDGSGDRSPGVQQFLAELAAATDEVDQAGEDSGRLMTIYDVTLESVKKIGDADVLVGVGGDGADEGPLIVTRTQDPNVTHPVRQTDIVGSIDTLHGQAFTAHTFQAIVRKYNLKDERKYCWKASEGVLTRYSHDVTAFIKRLSAADVDAALTDYRQFLRASAIARRKKQ